MNVSSVSDARKRKRQEPLVKSRVTLCQSPQDHLNEYEDREDCSRRVCKTVQQSLAPNQDVSGACQQLTVNAHAGSFQPVQTVHSALLHTATESFKASYEHACSVDFKAEQVCFGMVRLQLLLPLAFAPTKC